MSNGLAPGKIILKLIEIGARRGCKPRTPMRFSLIGAVLPALVVCNVAMAQVDGQFDGTVNPTPIVGATSPLGIAGSPTGIPLGSTEITSPGVSPLPAGVTGTITIPTTTTSTACPTVATPPSEMFGSTASFDGGGMSGRRPEDHGRNRRIAAGAAVRRDPRPHPDDVSERDRLHSDHSAVRIEPQRRSSSPQRSSSSMSFSACSTKA
jgi:hypothetical protein